EGAMRYLAAFGAALAAALATPAFAQSFVGEWIATAHLPGGVEVSETVKVARSGDGYAITAEAADPVQGAPQAGPGTDIAIEGDRFAYRRAVLSDEAIKLSYAGVVSGDAFTGTVEVAGTRVPYTGVRTG